MFFAPLLVFAVDLSLGRVDKDSFSQQTLMELFIDRMRNTDNICKDTQDGSNDVVNWEGLKFNDSDDIIIIDWHNFRLSGTLNLQWLPNAVRQVLLRANKFSSSIDLTVLPPVIVELNVAQNNLLGSVCLEALPSSMELLNLNQNRFSGEVNLTMLPKGMKKLNVHGNKFCGTVNLTSLPDTLEELYLYENDFLGETDFSQLPKSLVHFYVLCTKLSGTLLVPKGKHFGAGNSDITIIRE